jgi:hypothetical protein
MLLILNFQSLQKYVLISRKPNTQNDVNASDKMHILIFKDA